MLNRKQNVVQAYILDGGVGTKEALQFIALVKREQLEISNITLTRTNHIRYFGRIKIIKKYFTRLTNY